MEYKKKGTSWMKRILGNKGRRDLRRKRGTYPCGWNTRGRRPHGIQTRRREPHGIKTRRREHHGIQTKRRSPHGIWEKGSREYREPCEMQGEESSWNTEIKKKPLGTKEEERLMAFRGTYPGG
jgi:hypothetical protein